MNPEMRALYQEMILDHYKKPRQYGTMSDATHEAKGHNPLCGDKLTVFLKIAEDGTIADIRFEGSGCAISTASASMMSEYLLGKSAKTVDDFFNRFHDLLTHESVPEEDLEALGKLKVFEGVREFPMRVKCATLAWHTLKAAQSQKKEPISTE